MIANTGLIKDAALIINNYLALTDTMVICFSLLQIELN